MTPDSATIAGNDATPQIRLARDDDGAAIADLIRACFSAYPGCLFDWSEFPELRSPARHFAGLGGRLWVAEGGTVLGCVAGTPKDDGRRVELTKMYVADTLRGTGLAQMLFGKVLAFAQEVSAAEIILWSDTRFTRAHAFYEKLGFARQPGQRFLADLSDTYEYQYRLPLGEARP